MVDGSPPDQTALLGARSQPATWRARPRPRTRTRVLASALVTALLALTAALASLVTVEPAAAHTDLLQGSPGPGQRAGGTIDFVDLAFLDAVSDAVIEVSLDGVVLAGSTTVTDGAIIRHQLDEALSVAGRYEVAYTITSSDADRHTERYQFSYEPTAPQAFRLGGAPAPGSGSDGGIGTTRAIALVVFFGALAGLSFIYLRTLEQRRSQAPAPDDRVTGR